MVFVGSSRRIGSDCEYWRSFWFLWRSGSGSLSGRFWVVGFFRNVVFRSWVGV